MLTLFANVLTFRATCLQSSARAHIRCEWRRRPHRSWDPRAVWQTVVRRLGGPLGIRPVDAITFSLADLCEPTDRTLEAFELQEGQWVLIAGVKDNDPVGIRPFDAITFSLGDLWP